MVSNFADVDFQRLLDQTFPITRNGRFANIGANRQGLIDRLDDFDRLGQGTAFIAAVIVVQQLAGSIDQNRLGRRGADIDAQKAAATMTLSSARFT